MALLNFSYEDFTSSYKFVLNYKQNYMLDQPKSIQPQNQADNQKNQSTENQVHKVKKILQKPYQSRTAQENHYIGNFIKQNIGLTYLSEEVSPQFVKNLLKTAAIIYVKKDTVICQRGNKIQEMGLVISGQLAILVDEDNSEPIAEVNKDEIFDKLLENAKIFGRQLRKKNSNIQLSSNKLKSSASILQRQYDCIDDSLTLNVHNIDSYINQNQFFGFQDRSQSSTFTRTCVCLNDETTVLIFKEEKVMISLQAAFKEKLKKMTGILRQIQCFNFLDIDKLNLIIQNMIPRRKKRFQYVYKQGQESLYFYLLTEGQIKITKETSLFEQNPNMLYLNRKKLVEESLTNKGRETDKVQKIFIDRKVKKSMLPYANLSSMYNYRPMKKNLQIGLITPPSLFGEEQYKQKTLRDTSTMCSSLSIEYYQIKISKLEQIIGNKLLPTFRTQLRQLIRKKVLYRQAQYANSIQLQNSNNMNYFYIEEGKQQVQSPRKFRINKFNKSIYDQKKWKIVQQQQSNNPTFTTFNFHKMRNQSQSERTRVNKEEQYEDSEHACQNSTELKIMEITHTWKLMKEKVDMSLKASKKISPIRPTINLAKPLIASEYFFHTQRQSKRIDREHRKRIASLSKSFKVSRARDSQHI